MTTLVFGGLGHVGSWISHDLAARGEDVVIFDLGAAGLDGRGLDYLEPHRDRLTFENVDVLDVHTLFERMKAYEGRIDAVIFGVAVIAGPNFAKRPFRHIQINTVGMLNVLEACRILGVPKFVNLSSGAIYGDQPGGQTEETPVKVTDLYGATKASNEVLALQYGQTYGIDVRNARLYFVYGPGKLPSRMHVLYQAMFGPLEGLTDIISPNGGDQSLDWTHVRDTAAGVVALLDAPAEVAGEAFNISCGVAVPHRDIVGHVSEIVGHDSNMAIGPGLFFERGAPLDISKARARLGFAPRFADIREGLRDYRAWLEGVGAITST
ncbi:NAD(P)-dependent oxidoreductase [Aurantimonas sp. C2-6-R+9]|uniref:NAD-dependent epimerase/dehydratase family protein n=1 Tax=unclassified Aurantimonas TaxID=2638230 RepID=UPI002E16D15C|nr:MULTISPECIES: NAD(P)-dependent oxidoreductase [unclassified Aurantimonas]MEC5292485.1 NAD(P)-dependent oxidoreductase [Aurantimonas sp. C2-3-R2]MEC5382690.1 NAD(P)-dependent oxidoreductase [Aurantimonas sp. C2-6-R+9]MEC5413517.1 NAD(P)-dependent oxidoreductase [Aurantimonas sp. C2-4-R8]